jgi:hypothetical protein
MDNISRALADTLPPQMEPFTGRFVTKLPMGTLYKYHAGS